MVRTCHRPSTDKANKQAENTHLSDPITCKDRWICLAFEFHSIELVQRKHGTWCVLKFLDASRDGDTTYSQDFRDIMVMSRKPMRPCGNQKCCSTNSSRPSTRNNPVALHSPDQTQSCQCHGVGFFVKIHMGRESVDKQGRIDNFDL